MYYIMFTLSSIIGHITLISKLSTQNWFYWTNIFYVVYVCKTETTHADVTSS